MLTVMKVGSNRPSCRKTIKNHFPDVIANYKPFVGILWG
jgi:hypothetical protein